MKKFLAKNYIAVAATLGVVVIIGLIWYVASHHAPSFNATTVGKGNVVESVNDPGNVLTENSADLSFQEAGEIVRVNVSEGSVVGAGAVLASLDQTQLQASVQQANAGLATAQAQLDELTSGTRPEQLQLDISAVASASTTLNNDLVNAYSAADDAVTNQLDNLFSNAQTKNPTFIVPSTNSQTINNIAAQRVALGGTLATWYAEISATTTTNNSLLLSTTNSALQQINAYINSISLIVNQAIPNATISVTTLAQYKADVATARTEVQGAIGTVSSAQSALTTAQNQLALAQAGSTPQAIEAQQAVVLQARAAVASAQVALNHSALIAPFSGTVQNLTGKVGQVVSPGVPVLSLINSSGLKIETYVSEADIAKVKTGDTANVTLDAYGTSVIFPAIVSTIDAAQTEVNGSQAYKVTLHFAKPDSRIKDGMTANVNIIAAIHNDVIEVPSNVVITDNNSSYVLVQNGSTIEKKQVTIGVVGDNNMTEITSGLNVGDHITNF